jgi:hypothetical protein
MRILQERISLFLEQIGDDDSRITDKTWGLDVEGRRCQKYRHLLPSEMNSEDGLYANGGKHPLAEAPGQQHSGTALHISFRFKATQG